MKGKLPFRWEGGVMVKAKVGRELRRRICGGGGKAVVRGSLKVWRAKVGAGIEMCFQTHPPSSRNGQSIQKLQYAQIEGTVRNVFPHELLVIIHNNWSPVGICYCEFRSQLAEGKEITIHDVFPKDCPA